VLIAAAAADDCWLQHVPCSFLLLLLLLLCIATGLPSDASLFGPLAIAVPGEVQGLAEVRVHDQHSWCVLRALFCFCTMLCARAMNTPCWLC
jgi:hypothetical protein